MLLSQTYNSFSMIIIILCFMFPMADNFHHYLSAYQGDKPPFIRSYILMERICSYRSKFFLLRVDPIKKGGKNKNIRVVPLDCVSIHLNSLKLPTLYLTKLLAASMLFVETKILFKTAKLSFILDNNWKRCNI